MIVTSVCSRSEWTQRTVLYGSTTAVATCGHAQVVKLSFDFFAVIHGQPLQHQATKSRASSSTTSMEYHEALQTGTVVSKLPNAIEDQVHKDTAWYMLSRASFAEKRVEGVISAADCLV